jgi:ribosomal protein L32
MKEIGVCSICGEPRVTDAECKNCGEEGETWKIM